MHPNTLHKGKQSPVPGGKFMLVYFKNKLFLKSYFPCSYVTELGKRAVSLRWQGMWRWLSLETAFCAHMRN